jgi:hypothetical protein
MVQSNQAGEISEHLRRKSFTILADRVTWLLSVPRSLVNGTICIKSAFIALRTFNVFVCSWLQGNDPEVRA